MKVLDIIENEDGSATVTFEMIKEEHDLLIGYAIVDILKKEINKSKEDSGDAEDDVKD